MDGWMELLNLLLLSSSMLSSRCQLFTHSNRTLMLLSVSSSASASSALPSSSSSCLFCFKGRHAPKSCPSFKQLKANTSKFSYQCKGNSIKQCDRDGFASAFLLPYIKPADSTDILVLLALESRHGHMKLNFIGGKRDAVAETPQQTAVREFIEETGSETNGLLRAETIKQLKSHDFSNTSVLWNNQAKLLLFSYELPLIEADIVQKSKQAVTLIKKQLSTVQVEISSTNNDSKEHKIVKVEQLQTNQIVMDEVFGLEWMSLSDLAKEFDAKNRRMQVDLPKLKLHHFSAQIVADIERKGGLRNFVAGNPTESKANAVEDLAASIDKLSINRVENNPNAGTDRAHNSAPNHNSALCQKTELSDIDKGETAYQLQAEQKQ
jgi:ADP-ribose pyrophosphatase YjhB (NUDIX family)